MSLRESYDFLHLRYCFDWETICRSMEICLTLWTDLAERCLAINCDDLLRENQNALLGIRVLQMTASGFISQYRALFASFMDPGFTSKYIRGKLDSCSAKWSHLGEYTAKLLSHD